MNGARNLTGKQKAAIILLSLGPEVSAQILRHLSEEKIEQLSMEITRLGKVTLPARQAVIEEFYHMCIAQEYILEGGIDYARELLERALGAQKAIEILSRLSMLAGGTAPFDFIKSIDPGQLLSFLSNEHPQTIALVLAHLRPEHAAAILSGLAPELRSEVAMRMAVMDRTAPEIVREVGKLLEEQVASFGSAEFATAGGIKTLVQILNRVDRGTEKSILESLEQNNPELAEEVKKLLFVFEDIVFLDDRSIQLVLREVDMKDLALALRAASDEVRNRIFKNMSERAATMLKEEIEYMGPVRLRLVEEAQQRIANIIRRLDETGVISIGREEEILV